MKLSEGTEWAIHCCSLLANLPPDFALPKSRLAEFFDLPEDYLAKFLQELSRAGLVKTSRGPGGGYQLAKPAGQINVLEIVQAVEGDQHFFQCTEIRRCGPSGVADKHYKKPCGIARTMHRAEAAWRAELAAVSLNEISQMGAEESPQEQIEKSLSWFESVM